MGMKYRQCHLQSCCMFTDVDGKQWIDAWRGPIIGNIVWSANPVTVPDF